MLPGTPVAVVLFKLRPATSVEGVLRFMYRLLMLQIAMCCWSLNMFNVWSMASCNEFFPVMMWCLHCLFAVRKMRCRRLWWPVTSTRYCICSLVQPNRINGTTVDTYLHYVLLCFHTFNVSPVSTKSLIIIWAIHFFPYPICVFGVARVLANHTL